MIRLRILSVFFLCFSLTLPIQAAEKETAFDRVMRTQTIRCGYGLAEPWIYRDMKNGGELKGFMVDVAHEMGRRLGLKIEWAEEVGWDQIAAALHAGRIDVGCSTLWQSAARGRVMAFTRPVFYSAIYAYARAGDDRFDGSINNINQKETRITVMDGDITAEVTRQLFPQATPIPMPMMSTPDQMMMNVMTKKADVVFAESSFFNTWSKQHPGKMKQVPLPKPLRVYGNAYPVYI